MKILLIDDDPKVGRVITDFLTTKGFSVTYCSSPRKALELLEREWYVIVITDIRMPEITGIDIINEVKKTSMETEVIIITGYGDYQTAIAALRGGAADFLSKPVDLNELLFAVQKTLKIHELREGNIRYKQHIERERMEAEERLGATRFMGVSAAARKIRSLIKKAASAPYSTVLLTGESGTGKDLVANLIHAHSPRRDKPFITVNCSGFMPTLIESELFGHERGAFTGAVALKKGVFELADKGDLFLDEIGDMPLNLQGRLLRVIEEKTFRRVGGQKKIEVDVRMIIATNKDLLRLIKEDRFREDLYYRINIFRIEIPPLRGRREDIHLLARHYLKVFSRKLRKHVSGITKEALEMLAEYHYPGNVRELKNMMERAVILTEENVLTPAHFSAYLDAPPPLPDTKNTPSTPRYEYAGGGLPEAEKAMIREALEKNRWHLKRTAEYLNIGYDALRYRMRKYNLHK